MRELYQKPSGVINPLDYTPETKARRYVNITELAVERIYRNGPREDAFRRLDYANENEVGLARNLREQGLPTPTFEFDDYEGKYHISGTLQDREFYETIYAGLKLYERRLLNETNYNNQKIDTLMGELFFRLTRIAHAALGTQEPTASAPKTIK